MNRLHLDFSIDSIEGRTSFVKEYIDQNEFKVRPLNSSEIEKISNYILWGKTSTGKKDDSYSLPTKWNDEAKTESYEALLESPTFNESMFCVDRPPTKAVHEKLSRAQIRKTAPQDILKEFEELWRLIDETELKINYYEILTGKRTKEPRDKLLERFTAADREKLQQAALQLTQRQYLQLRHNLVDLRQQQYTLKDAFTHTVVARNIVNTPSVKPFSFDTDIDVLPLGIKNDGKARTLVFKHNLSPDCFTENELKGISRLIWDTEVGENCFDFRNADHVYQLLLLRDSLDGEPSANEIFTEFLNTLQFYIEEANFTDIQLRILELKCAKVTNDKIVSILNKEFGKHYGANYISTIFKQKIVKGITLAADHHYELICNLFFPENFKKCKDCGTVLLKTEYNFIHDIKSSDGFSRRCKKCSKELRKRG